MQQSGHAPNTRSPQKKKKKKQKGEKRRKNRNWKEVRDCDCPSGL